MAAVSEIQLGEIAGGYQLAKDGLVVTATLPEVFVDGRALSALLTVNRGLDSWDAGFAHPDSTRPNSHGGCGSKEQ